MFVSTVATEMRSPWMIVLGHHARSKLGSTPREASASLRARGLVARVERPLLKPADWRRSQAAGQGVSDALGGREEVEIVALEGTRR